MFEPTLALIGPKLTTVTNQNRGSENKGGEIETNCKGSRALESLDDQA